MMYRCDCGARWEDLAEVSHCPICGVCYLAEGQEPDPPDRCPMVESDIAEDLENQHYRTGETQE